MSKATASDLRDGPALNGAPLERLLRLTWATPAGLCGWLATVDHKQVGRRYIVTAFVFFLLGRRRWRC